MKAAEIEDEIEKTVAALPTEPGADYMKQIKLKGSAIIYSDIPDNKKFMRCYCSACKNTYLSERCYREIPGCTRGGYLKYYSVGIVEPSTNNCKFHKDTFLCPICGKGTKVYYDKAMNGCESLDKKLRMCAYNIRGHLVLLLFCIDQMIRPDGTEFIKILRGDGQLYVCGRFVRVTGEVKYYTSYTYLDHFERRKRFSLMQTEMNRSEILGLTNEMLAETECEKSGLVEFVNYSAKPNNIEPFVYLYVWKKLPQIENLVKSGYISYVQEVLDTTVHIGSYYSREQHFNYEDAKKYINPKEVKPFRIMGLEKHELLLAKKFGLGILDYYKECKARGVILNEEQLEFIKRMGKYRLEDMTLKPYRNKKIPIIRTINYIMSQDKKLKDRKKFSPVSAGYLADYWDAVAKVYGTLRDDLMYPKNLVRAHDRMILAVKEKENERLTELMMGLYDKRAPLEFTDTETGLMIVPAKTHGELIKEGKLLHHCVGSYAERHASGKTTILFIRKIAEPDKPFFTLELTKSGNIMQNRGFKNRDPDNTVKQFAGKWFREKAPEISALTKQLSAV